MPFFSFEFSNKYLQYLHIMYACTIRKYVLGWDLVGVNHNCIDSFMLCESKYMIRNCTFSHQIQGQQILLMTVETQSWPLKSMESHETQDFTKPDGNSTFMIPILHVNVSRPHEAEQTWMVDGSHNILSLGRNINTYLWYIY